MISFDKMLRELLDNIIDKTVETFQSDLAHRLHGMVNEYSAKAAEDLRKGIGNLTFRMQKQVNSDRYEIVIYTKLEGDK